MILYNFILFFLRIIILISRPFSKKIQNFLKVREIEKNKYQNYKSKKKTIWLHSASVGELDQAKSVAVVIKKKEKDCFILQTVFSDSVLEKNFDRINTDLTIHLPLDFKNNYDWIFEAFKPRAIILFAWDTWINLIYKAKKENVKLFLNSATWDENSSRKNFSFFKTLFSKFDGISPVKKEMEQNFKDFSLNIPKIISCGDSRFDSVSKKINSTKPDLIFQKNIKILEYSKILILASTYTECEKIIFPCLKQILEKGFRVWIFPHKIDTSRINEIKLNLKEFDFGIYSNLKPNDKDKKIILFDVLGILAYSYNYAKIAYVGGAIHNKVHNVLEPSYFGLGLITGKKIQNSSDAIELLKEGFLKKMQTENGFLESLDFFEKNYNQEFKNKISTYVKTGIGSSEKFYNEFLKNL